MNYHLTRRSENRKTGPIPVSTTGAQSCPQACPFKTANFGRTGCYANEGRLSIHWRMVTNGKRGGTLSEFVAAIEALPAGTLWRHNQAGDLPSKPDDPDTIDGSQLYRIVRANQGKRGFTFTHYGMDSADNRASVAGANSLGFTINLSGHGLRDADRLLALGAGPVAVTIPEGSPRTQRTPQGATVRQCPAQYAETTCSRCQWCAKPNRSWVVGFAPEGKTSKRIDPISKGG